MQSVKFLSQDEAINLDQELFNDYKFSVDQLMELAGLGVAQVIAKCYPSTKSQRVLVCVGPGNNGGDGLVCARHLKLFGYQPLVICAKPGRTDLYERLMTQCTKFGVLVLPSGGLNDMEYHPDDIFVDSIFGFSFKPPSRNEQCAKVLQQMCKASRDFKIPIVSIDIPSGWHVESGSSYIGSQEDVPDALKIPVLEPDCLVSLTAPKLCARGFTGRFHYLAGRFCPESLQQKYQLNLPAYPGSEGTLEL